MNYLSRVLDENPLENFPNISEYLTKLTEALQHVEEKIIRKENETDIIEISISNVGIEVSTNARKKNSIYPLNPELTFETLKVIRHLNTLQRLTIFIANLSCRISDLKVNGCISHSSDDPIFIEEITKQTKLLISNIQQAVSEHFNE